MQEQKEPHQETLNPMSRSDVLFRSMQSRLGGHSRNTEPGGERAAGRSLSPTLPRALHASQPTALERAIGSIPAQDSCSSINFSELEKMKISTAQKIALLELAAEDRYRLNSRYSNLYGAVMALVQNNTRLRAEVVEGLTVRELLEEENQQLAMLAQYNKTQVPMHFLGKAAKVLRNRVNLTIKRRSYKHALMRWYAAVGLKEDREKYLLRMRGTFSEPPMAVLTTPSSGQPQYTLGKDGLREVQTPQAAVAAQQGYGDGEKGDLFHSANRPRGLFASVSRANTYAAKRAQAIQNIVGSGPETKHVPWKLEQTKNASPSNGSSFALDDEGDGKDWAAKKQGDVNNFQEQQRHSQNDAQGNQIEGDHCPKKVMSTEVHGQQDQFMSHGYPTYPQVSNESQTHYFVANLHEGSSLVNLVPVVCSPDGFRAQTPNIILKGQENNLHNHLVQPLHSESSHLDSQINASSNKGSLPKAGSAHFDQRAMESPNPSLSIPFPTKAATWPNLEMAPANPSAVEDFQTFHPIQVIAVPNIPMSYACPEVLESSSQSPLTTARALSLQPAQSSNLTVVSPHQQLISSSTPRGIDEIDLFLNSDEFATDVPAHFSSVMTPRSENQQQSEHLADQQTQHQSVPDNMAQNNYYSEIQNQVIAVPNISMPMSYSCTEVLESYSQSPLTTARAPSLQADQSSASTVVSPYQQLISSSTPRGIDGIDLFLNSNEFETDVLTHSSFITPRSENQQQAEHFADQQTQHQSVPDNMAQNNNCTETKNQFTCGFTDQTSPCEPEIPKNQVETNPSNHSVLAISISPRRSLTNPTVALETPKGSVPGDSMNMLDDEAKLKKLENNTNLPNRPILGIKATPRGSLNIDSLNMPISSADKSVKVLNNEEQLKKLEKKRNLPNRPVLPITSTPRGSIAFDSLNMPISNRHPEISDPQNNVCTISQQSPRGAGDSINMLDDEAKLKKLENKANLPNRPTLAIKSTPRGSLNIDSLNMPISRTDKSRKIPNNEERLKKLEKKRNLPNRPVLAITSTPRGSIAIDSLNMPISNHHLEISDLQTHVCTISQESPRRAVPNNSIDTPNGKVQLSKRVEQPNRPFLSIKTTPRGSCAIDSLNPPNANGNLEKSKPGNGICSKIKDSPRGSGRPPRSPKSKNRPHLGIESTPRGSLAVDSVCVDESKVKTRPILSIKQTPRGSLSVDSLNRENKNDLETLSPRPKTSSKCPSVDSVTSEKNPNNAQPSTKLGLAIQNIQKLGDDSERSHTSEGSFEFLAMSRPRVISDIGSSRSSKVSPRRDGVQSEQSHTSDGSFEVVAMSRPRVINDIGSARSSKFSPRLDGEQSELTHTSDSNFEVVVMSRPRVTNDIGSARSSKFSPSLNKPSEPGSPSKRPVIPFLKITPMGTPTSSAMNSTDDSIRQQDPEHGPLTSRERGESEYYGYSSDDEYAPVNFTDGTPRWKKKTLSQAPEISAPKTPQSVRFEEQKDQDIKRQLSGPSNFPLHKPGFDPNGIADEENLDQLEGALDQQSLSREFRKASAASILDSDSVTTTPLLQDKSRRKMIRKRSKSDPSLRRPTPSVLSLLEEQNRRPLEVKRSSESLMNSSAYCSAYSEAFPWDGTNESQLQDLITVTDKDFWAKESNDSSSNQDDDPSRLMPPPPSRTMPPPPAAQPQPNFLGASPMQPPQARVSPMHPLNIPSDEEPFAALTSSNEHEVSRIPMVDHSSLYDSFQQRAAMSPAGRGAKLRQRPRWISSPAASGTVENYLLLDPKGLLQKSTDATQNKTAIHTTDIPYLPKDNVLQRKRFY